MRLFTLRGIAIRCDFLVLLVVPLLLLLDAGETLLVALACLTLHELAHTVIARAWGYDVVAIEIQPFGFVARMGSGFHSTASELAVAAAGPAASLLLATATAAVMYHFPALFAPLSYFLRFNLMLALVNLIPALPLDGGRMLRCLLARLLRPRLAMLLTAWLGVLLGAGLCAVAVLAWQQAPNITLALLGVFLLLGAVRELRDLPGAQLSAMMRRSRALRRGESLPVRQRTLHADTRCTDALKHLAAGQYNLIYVVDDDMRVLGSLDEQTLLHGMARQGGSATLGSLLRQRQSAAD